MVFRRTGCAAYSVAPRSAADEQNQIPRLRSSTVHHIPRSRSDFHALGNITGMVNLRNLASGKPYLVPVAAVAVCRSDYNFALGKLAGNSLFKRQSRVCGPSDAHCLVYIASA